LQREDELWIIDMTKTILGILISLLSDVSTVAVAV